MVREAPFIRRQGPEHFWVAKLPYHVDQCTVGAAPVDGTEGVPLQHQPHWHWHTEVLPGADV
eukprot:10868344-Prorocentrum_lima.AAC.1